MFCSLEEPKCKKSIVCSKEPFKNETCLLKKNSNCPRAPKICPLLTSSDKLFSEEAKNILCDGSKNLCIAKTLSTCSSNCPLSFKKKHENEANKTDLKPNPKDIIKDFCFCPPKCFPCPPVDCSCFITPSCATCSLSCLPLVSLIPDINISKFQNTFPISKLTPKCKPLEKKCPFEPTKIVCSDNCDCSNVPELDLGPDCPFDKSPKIVSKSPLCPFLTSDCACPTPLCSCSLPPCNCFQTPCVCSSQCPILPSCYNPFSTSSTCCALPPCVPLLKPCFVSCKSCQFSKACIAKNNENIDDISKNNNKESTFHLPKCPAFNPPCQIHGIDTKKPTCPFAPHPCPLTGTLYCPIPVKVDIVSNNLDEREDIKELPEKFTKTATNLNQNNDIEQLSFKIKEKHQEADSVYINDLDETIDSEAKMNKRKLSKVIPNKIPKELPNQNNHQKTQDNLMSNNKSSQGEHSLVSTEQLKIEESKKTFSNFKSNKNIAPIETKCSLKPPNTCLLPLSEECKYSSTSKQNMSWNGDGLQESETDEENSNLNKIKNTHSKDTEVLSHSQTLSCPKNSISNCSLQLQSVCLLTPPTCPLKTKLTCKCETSMCFLNPDPPCPLIPSMCPLKPKSSCPFITPICPLKPQPSCPLKTSCLLEPKYPCKCGTPTGPLIPPTCPLKPKSSCRFITPICPLKPQTSCPLTPSSCLLEPKGPCKCGTPTCPLIPPVCQLKPKPPCPCLTPNCPLMPKECPCSLKPSSCPLSSSPSPLDSQSSCLTMSDPPMASLLQPSCSFTPKPPYLLTEPPLQNTKPPECVVNKEKSQFLKIIKLPCPKLPLCCPLTPKPLCIDNNPSSCPFGPPSCPRGPPYCSVNFKCPIAPEPPILKLPPCQRKVCFQFEQPQINSIQDINDKRDE